ncbi:MAG: SURF1 family protein [Gemmatimonadota bacterium]|nr:SURF1 family protein [Gemmatimonadota bacterium]
MSRRILVFSLFAVALAALFTRLGFWQISRMHERQALNAYIASRMDSTPVPFFALSGDSAVTHFRRVTLSGTPDFAHEVYITEVSRSGSPGVYVITPVRVAGHDTAVLVNRGWVYAPDASTIEPDRWHAPDSVFDGYVDEFQHPLPVLREPHHLRTINYAQISAQLPYPIADTYVVALGKDSVISGVPLRIDPPPLDEGPFRSYAIQWFAFALISIGGATFVALKDREARRAAARQESPNAGA